MSCGPPSSFSSRRALRLSAPARPRSSDGPSYLPPGTRQRKGRGIGLTGYQLLARPGYEIARHAREVARNRIDREQHAGVVGANQPLDDDGHLVFRIRQTLRPVVRPYPVAVPRLAHDADCLTDVLIRSRVQHCLEFARERRPRRVFAQRRRPNGEGSSFTIPSQAGEMALGQRPRLVRQVVVDESDREDDEPVGHRIARAIQPGQRSALAAGERLPVAGQLTEGVDHAHESLLARVVPSRSIPPGSRRPDRRQPIEVATGIAGQSASGNVAPPMIHPDGRRSGDRKPTASDARQPGRIRDSRSRVSRPDRPRPQDSRRRRRPGFGGLCLACLRRASCRPAASDGSCHR